ncbi:hypothetical protein [Streptomyces chrestomyceticus]|uniref:hypothetical protein n=1 Tax=Streptomyces chrestomyceticus TaxID=68185 RepID=UPI001FD282A8|nr:hypothetical protein [Streptomyces chrestomyceticus]
MLAQVDAHGGRAPHHTGHVRLELAAGVVDLHTHGSAAGLGGRGPLGERLQRRGGLDASTPEAVAGQVRGAVHALCAASSAIP